jgi:hypothetical protein
LQQDKGSAQTKQILAKQALTRQGALAVLSGRFSSIFPALQPGKRHETPDERRKQGKTDAASQVLSQPGNG